MWLDILQRGIFCSSTALQDILTEESVPVILRRASDVKSVVRSRDFAIWPMLVMLIDMIRGSIPSVRSTPLDLPYHKAHDGLCRSS